MSQSPSHWRVRYLNLTRWWRHCTAYHRWLAATYALVGVLNVAAWNGWLPWSSAESTRDPLTLAVIFLMLAFAGWYLHLGHRQWRREWERERIKDELAWNLQRLYEGRPE